MEQYISKSALLAEIERLVNNYDKALDYEAALEDVRNFLDTLEVKEPQVKESAEIERDKETCKENGNSLTQEPAINVWHDMSEDAENDKNIIIIDPKGFYGAVLRKGGYQRRKHNKERYVKWAYIDDLQNFSNVKRTGKNWNEPVSNDLEKAAVEAFKQIVDSDKNNFLEIFKAGVKWQAEQFEKNRLAACDRQAEEEAEIESDFVMGIIEREHRQPTFDDAIKYGMRLQKERLLAKVVDGEDSLTLDGVITFDYYDGDKAYGCVAHDSFCLEDWGLKDMDKVKILILKKY